MLKSSFILRLAFRSLVLASVGLALSGTKPHPATAAPPYVLYLPVIHRPVDISVLRPYTTTSIWNTPIDPVPQYDPNSAVMIATIPATAFGGFTSDPNQYTFPVYFVDQTTPRWNVPCVRTKCTIVSPSGVTTVNTLTNVPIPPQAQPAAGSDAQMIIVDRTNGTEYDLYEVVYSNNTWSVSNGSVYNVYWDGTPSRYGSRGAGIPYYAGLVRPWEIRQGRIEHALAFGYPEPSNQGCVFPASKTDGDSTLANTLPEGARLQLDPTLTETDFNSWGLSATGKIIARALQEYGMFLVDDSGSSKIYIENLIANPYATEQWTDAGLNLTNKTITTIPYTAFRVLKLPAAYWNPTLGGTKHGSCYR